MGNLMGQVKVFIAEEMLKAKQKPEEEIKVEAEKTEEENIEKVEEIKNKGIDHYFVGTSRNVVNLWIV
jgi:hypothetical protein